MSNRQLGYTGGAGQLLAAAFALCAFAGCAPQQYRISVAPSLRPVDSGRSMVVFSQIQGKACGRDAVLGAIRDMKRLQGVDGPKTAHTVLILADIMQAQGRYKDAQKLAEIALDIYVRGGVHRSVHPEAYQRIAVAQASQGRWEQAMATYDKLKAAVADDPIARQRYFDTNLDLAVALVRGLHPRPGSTVSAAKAEYVVPDVFVRRTDRGWTVEVNSSTLPRVRLNQSYADMLGRGAGHSSMRAQLQEARWLLKSLEIRNETLMKVARSIVERQTAFLEHGEESMRPMILKDIAQAIDMHESTISRVTSSKYMHTPRGVFELKYFFSSQVEAADGGGASSTAVRAKIRKLIKEEDPGNPLSDSRIAELLSGEGIAVARRTVAKYREALGLAPSNERKARAAAR